MPEEELDYEAARVERLMHAAGRARFAHGDCVAALGNRMDDAATLRWREELNLMLTACALGTPSPESLATLSTSWLKGLVGVLASLVHTQAHHPFPKPILHLGQWHGARIVRFLGAEEPPELDGVIETEGHDYGPTVLDSLQLRLQWAGASARNCGGLSRQSGTVSGLAAESAASGMSSAATVARREEARFTGELTLKPCRLLRRRRQRHRVTAFLGAAAAPLPSARRS